MAALEPEARRPESQLQDSYASVLETKSEAERLHRLQKGLAKSARGAFRAAAVLDFQAVRKQAAVTKALLATYSEQFNLWESVVSSFRLSDISEQEYRQAFEAACQKADLRLEGSFPSYEVFPFDIRFSLVQEQVVVNRRVHRTMDPEYLATLRIPAGESSEIYPRSQGRAL